jgi:hypothetical protein
VLALETAINGSLVVAFGYTHAAIKDGGRGWKMSKRLRLSDLADGSVVPDGVGGPSFLLGGDPYDETTMDEMLDRISIDLDSICSSVDTNTLNAVVIGKSVKGVTVTGVTSMTPGANGSVYEIAATYTGRRPSVSANFVVKVQRFRHGSGGKVNGKLVAAKEALQNLVRFAGCNVVAFRAWERKCTYETVIVTVMEKADTDLFDLMFVPGRPRFNGRNLDRLVHFLATFWDCLTRFGTSYVDMKPENIGVYINGEDYVFRVIDVDSLGTTIATPGYTESGNIDKYNRMIDSFARRQGDRRETTAEQAEYMRRVGLFGMIIVIAMCSVDYAYRNRLYAETTIGVELDTRTGRKVPITKERRLSKFEEAIRTRRSDVQEPTILAVNQILAEAKPLI